MRIKALEEALKKEEIDQETFDKVRFQIAGGDLESTHLVKGLDFKLLERIRKGEDVYESTESKEEDVEDVEPEDVDEAFEQLEEAEVEAIAREKANKKGEFSTTTTLKPGQKRSRAMILAEMKAAREAAKAKEESALGSKFKKIGAKAPGSRIERDNKGREVLIIIDEDGHEKRKVRKIQQTSEEDAAAEAKARDLMMPDKNAEVLGMEVPDIYKPKPTVPEDKDIDIFDDVGDDYDPLAGLEEEDSDEEGEAEESAKVPSEKEAPPVLNAMPPPPRPLSTSEPRNYFKDSKTALVSSQNLQAPSMSDPAVLAAFKKAASLNPIARSSEDDDDETKAKAERHRKMLQNDDRDAEDMDMGFGTSRFEDEADFDDTKVKLSEWGNDGDDGDGRGGDGKGKRKRGSKKRKGDVNSAADVLRVMEQRKAAK